VPSGSGPSGATACPIVVTNAHALKDSLERARSGTVIEVPDGVNIDLDGFLPLSIGADVTLRSGRGARRLGAELRVDERTESVAVSITGNNAKLIGFRLRGPYGGIVDNAPRVHAVLVDVGAIGKTRSAGTVPVAPLIEGNEIYNWPGTAINVQGTEKNEECKASSGGRSFDITIRNNYIHHNQIDRLGYGVGVWDGAFPLVEGNTFEWNRHSISADGDPRSGYVARYNYVLSGASRYKPKFLYEGSYGQHFDMHGDDNPPDPDPKTGRGGNAGDIVLIQGNTVHGEQRYEVFGIGETRAVYWLRGRPCGRHEIVDNVLVHEQDEAVRTKDWWGNDWGGTGYYRLAHNRFDTDTSWSIGVGDFDRDGRDDLFQATGAAWYHSSSGETEWRVLQTHRGETLDKLRLGDFNGDLVTDVFTAANGKWLVSWGGTTAWDDIGASDIGLEDLRFADFNGDGRTDVFRASGSRWYYSPSGSGHWQPLAESVYRVDELRFGNFDGNKRADVFGLVHDHWSVSYDGVSAWRPLNSALSTKLDSLVFADFNGDGRTDIAQSHIWSPRGTQIEWRVSWSGTTGWNHLRNPGGLNDVRAHLYNHWIGRFDSSPGVDAIRYQPLYNPLTGATTDGVYLIRSSGARESYARHSRYAMR
jgi:hypothetical protein